MLHLPRHLDTPPLRSAQRNEFSDLMAQFRRLAPDARQRQLAPGLITKNVVHIRFAMGVEEHLAAEPLDRATISSAFDPEPQARLGRRREDEGAACG
jgi:hypothetical protein